jgi:hypothetical protein
MHSSKQGFSPPPLSPFQQALALPALQAVSQVQQRHYAKDVRYGIEARNSVLMGVNKLADAVQVTLGPKVCCLTYLH